MVRGSNKDRIKALLKSIETGDPGPIDVVNEEKYIQHNPQTHEGSEGLADLFERLSRTSPRVNVVRAFEDGDFVFAHTEYDFATRRIGFEVFRFEDGYAVEHWDNIQPRLGPNKSGHTMVDGPTQSEDHQLTEQNRSLVRSFLQNILIQRKLNELEVYIDNENFTEHNPNLSDDLFDLRQVLDKGHHSYGHSIYEKVHLILAEGNFVLTGSEGLYCGVHSAFYDLFRIAHGKIVEHWDTIEKIAPRSEWKNENGKF